MKKGKVDAHGYFLFGGVILCTILIFVTAGIGIYYNIKSREESHDNLYQSVMNRSVQTVVTKPEKKHVHFKEGDKSFSFPLKCKVCADKIFSVGEPKKKEKKPVWKFLGTFNVSAYCPCSRCCRGFSDGKTATMKDAYTRGVAVDTRIIPFGTKLYIPDYGVAIADDVGGSIKKNKLDVRFKTHREARYFGRKYLKVYYLEEK